MTDPVGSVCIGAPGAIKPPLPTTTSTDTSLPCRIEEHLTKWFYKDAEHALEHANSAGVLVPLWLWTHAAYVEADRLDKPVAKAANLVRWLLRNALEPRHVAVVCANTELQKRIRGALASERDAAAREVEPHDTCRGSVAVLLPQDIPAALRRSIAASYRSVIYVMEPAPTDACVATAQHSEEHMALCLGSATEMCVTIADAAWTSLHVRGKWPGWRLFLEKLEQQDVICASRKIAVEARSGGLVGAKLPICCGLHHGQRELMSGMQDISSQGFCKRLTLRGHHCHEPSHVSSIVCPQGGCAAQASSDHRNESAGMSSCPFACTKTLADCGHPCRMQCSDQCNCLIIVREPLPCSHSIVIGLDTETQQPLYATVPHVFSGFCCDKGLPCVVTVPTVCSRCLGAFTAPCHVLTSVGHTLENRTATCSDCLKLEMEVKSAVMAEVLVRAEQKKRDMKTALARSVFEQRKGAARGVFCVGARIVIRDVSKVIPPINPETDFPGKVFVDVDDDSQLHKLYGSMGVIDSQHVDVDDPTELRSLVRLSSGRYCLVGDGGMEFIRGDLSSVTGIGQPLLLLAAPPEASTPAADNSSAAEPCAADTEEAKVRRASMLGKKFLLMNTVTVSLATGRGSCDAPDDDGDNASTADLCEVVVRVIGEDAMRRPDYVHVETLVLDRRAQEMALRRQLSEAAQEDEESRALKRPRVEVRDARAVPPQSHDMAAATNAALRVLQFSARVTDLDPLPFSVADDSASDSSTRLTAGDTVSVSRPEAQITSPDFVSVAQDILHATAPNCQPSIATVSAIPVGATFKVRAVINAPLYNLADEARGFTSLKGPMCVLEPLAAVRSGGSTSARHRSSTFRSKAFSPSSSNNRMSSAASRPAMLSETTHRPLQYVLVPLVFVSADEVTDAMNRLDEEAQLEFHKLVGERVDQLTEQRALRNDELAYMAQLAMPPVSEVQRHEPRAPSVSEPRKVPSRDELLRLEQRAEKLPRGNPSTVKLHDAKEAAQEKLEQMRNKQYGAHYEAAISADREAMAAYVATWSKKAMLASVQHHAFGGHPRR